MTSESSNSKPTPSRRESAAQDKYARILKAALELFAERGFHGTAVPEVAKRAGVGAGTIYRYFDNKESLVNEVFRSSKTKLKGYLIENISGEGSIRERFHHFWQNLVRFARDNPVDFHFLELQDHQPYLDAESKKIELEVLVPIWALCVQGMRQGDIKELEAESLMALVWGAFVGLMKAESMGYTKATNITLEKAEEICWEMLASRH